MRVKGATKFEPLDVTKGIPLGSEVDARKGKVVLTSVPKAGGTPETATFYDGLFIVTQIGGITELRLSEKLTGCKTRQEEGRRRGQEAQDPQALGRRQGQVPHPRPVQRRHHPRHQVARPGHLHHARSRASPKASSSVDDFAKKKTVLVKQGKTLHGEAKPLSVPNDLTVWRLLDARVPVRVAVTMRVARRSCLAGLASLAARGPRSGGHLERHQHAATRRRRRATSTAHRA